MTDLAFAKSFLTTLDNKATKYQPDHVFDPEKFELRIPYTLPKLPHPPHPEPPKSVTPSQAPPGAEPATSTTNTINVTLKSSRNPNMTLSLPGTPPSTTIASLRQQVHSYLGGASVVGFDKIKILLNKKPVPSSKQTLADAVEGDAKDVEFGIMVMGGAPDPPPQTQATAMKSKPLEPSGPDSENAAIEAVTGRNPSDTANTVPSVSAMEGVERTTSGPKSDPVQPGQLSGKEVLQEDQFWDDLEGFLAQRIRDQTEATKLKMIFRRAFQSASSAP